MFPNIIHHTGDIQVHNSSMITNLTELTILCKTNTTIDNDNDYNYEDEPYLHQNKSSNGSGNVPYSEIVTNTQVLARTVQNDETMCKSVFTSLFQWISLTRHSE